MAATPVMECVVRVDVFVDIEVLHRDADAVVGIVSSRSRIGVVVTCMVGCCVAAPGNRVVVVVIGCNDR